MVLFAEKKAIKLIRPARSGETCTPAMPNAEVPRERMLNKSSFKKSIYSLISTAAPFQTSSARRQSGKRDKLGIPRKPVGSNIVLREALLGVDPPGLVKADASIPHDALNLSLGRRIETRARITLGDISREVKGAGREASLHVSGEGARKVRVDIVWYRNA